LESSSVEKLENLVSAPPANKASSALLIMWGSTTLLLCGDCEEPTWLAWTKEGGTLENQIAGIKVGHHGSVNGVYLPVLERVGPGTFAVLTPFMRGKRPLPDLQAVQEYCKQCGSVQITARGTRAKFEVNDSVPENNLQLLYSAVSDGDDDARKLLKLIPQTVLHDNLVTLLFNDQGKCVEHSGGRGTVAWQTMNAERHQ